jgi:KDO2-lipid IV(A) lauroyltransferase
MGKPRSRSTDYACYLGVRVVTCLLLSLPVSWSLWLVRTLALAIYLADRRHRNVAIDNLRQSFPARFSEEQLSRLTREVYQHFSMMLLELFLIPRKLRSRRWRREMKMIPSPDLREALTSGRPLLIVTAHYGNWELAAFMLSAYGIRGHLVGRPLDNPYLDAMLRRFRESAGHKVLSKHGDFGRMRAVLDAGGTLCTLADQDAGERGMFVDFFGRPASTHKAIAFLAQRTGALIIVVGAQNVGGLLNYALRVTDIIDAHDYARQAGALIAMTQRITAGVERLVRYDPRQYFWLHRRWKSQPQPTRAKKVA